MVVREQLGGDDGFEVRKLVLNILPWIVFKCALPKPVVELRGVKFLDDGDVPGRMFKS